MSGGAFNYAYRHVEFFCSEALSMESSAGLSKAESQRIRMIVAECQRAAALMKAAEWLLSGDTGEDTFLNETADVQCRNAAPEMLAALRAMRDSGPNGANNFHGWHAAYTDSCELALSAIAKAEGSP